MAITKNIVIGISDIYNEPDAILLKSTESSDDINIQVVTGKFTVKADDLMLGLHAVKEFVKKREPIIAKRSELINDEFYYEEQKTN